MRLPFAVAIVFCVGCSFAGQPAQAPAATRNDPPLPSATTTIQVPSTVAFDWVKRVGPIQYLELPKDTRGDWVVRAVLDDGSLVMSLTGNKPLSDVERSSFPFDLVRFDPRSASQRGLTHMPPGSQALFPTAAKDGLAWSR